MDIKQRCQGNREMEEYILVLNLIQNLVLFINGSKSVCF